MIEPLGGGRRYEVFLVWDDGIQAEAVAKVLRPDRMDDDERRQGAPTRG